MMNENNAIHSIEYTGRTARELPQESPEEEISLQTPAIAKAEPKVAAIEYLDEQDYDIIEMESVGDMAEVIDHKEEIRVKEEEVMQVLGVAERNLLKRPAQIMEQNEINEFDEFENFEDFDEFDEFEFGTFNDELFRDMDKSVDKKKKKMV